MKLSLHSPWLEADLGRPRRILSFAPYRPGFVTAQKILWREVRNTDLTPDFDAHLWLKQQLADRAALGRDAIGRDAAAGNAVAMMTSRRIEAYCQAQSGPVHAVATVGLGNAERIGHRRVHSPDFNPDASPHPDNGPHPDASYGTINIAVAIEAGLSDPAMIEALTIITQARTAAILDAGLRLPSGLATGTGTDCIALAADPGEIAYAGLHTPLGEALGRAVYDAVLQGAKDWIAEQILHPVADLPPTQGVMP